MSFVAANAGDIWQADVLHGPTITTKDGLRKTYLVSFMDDATRILTHTAFCLGESALDIQGVFKQAILKRGLPRRLIVDNGSAYRSNHLRYICAVLDIRLIYCRPYQPEGKGKLERFHRRFREQFLNELIPEKIQNLDDLNARLWAWVDQIYHQTPHSGLKGIAPIECWRKNLIHVRALGLKAEKIDDLFFHRYKRKVRKDGTVCFEGNRWEVPYEFVNDEVLLVVDPHTSQAKYIESLIGEYLGAVERLDPIANAHRKRQRPHHALKSATTPKQSTVEHALDAYEKTYALDPATISKEEE